MLSIPRTLFDEDHAAFRDTARRFMEQEVAPHHARWEEQAHVDREIWTKAGAAGFLCATMPEQYGGAGVDKRFSVVVMEEAARINATGLGWGLHSEIVAPYLLHYGSDFLKQKYLPKMASGEMIGAIAMTEPAAGSDLQGVRTTAVRDGDHYILNGSKIFITNGYLSDLVIVVAKTDPSQGRQGHQPAGGRYLDGRLQQGQAAAQGRHEGAGHLRAVLRQRAVPAENLLGEEGNGFVYLMQELPWERLQIAVIAIASAEAALDWTIQYTNERKAFGQEIAKFQNTRFKLAEFKTEIQVGRVFVDRCIELILENKLDPATASMAKYWCSDLQFKVMDECVQLHGGYGYMWEYPITRAWADARVQRIYGGTNEIMKELISRNL
jgi:alkylation response protein AidB-like acyl-CoA dehydrogenase